MFAGDGLPTPLLISKSLCRGCVSGSYRDDGIYTPEGSTDLVTLDECELKSIKIELVIRTH